MKYCNDEKLTKIAREIAKHIGVKEENIKRIFVVRSFGSKSNAIARIHGLSKVFQIALSCDCCYVIEVINRRFEKLNRREKLKTIIHELLHIPKSFSGGYRFHNYVTRERVNRVYEKIKDKFEKLF